MSREIRRVPKGWQHPKDERGRYIPMYDHDFESEARKWMDEAIAWDNGTHEKVVAEPDIKKDIPYYWQWENPPDEETCRPKFESEPTCYQIYEDVSEGTPDSPVFETEQEMINWLVKQGHSQNAAAEFVRVGWVPSGMIGPKGFASGIDMFDVYPADS